MIFNLKEKVLHHSARVIHGVHLAVTADDEKAVLSVHFVKTPARRYVPVLEVKQSRQLDPTRGQRSQAAA